MHLRLNRAMMRLLHDLDVTGAPTPRIEESDWQDYESAESAFLRSEDNSGMGVWVDTNLPEAEQVAMLADQVQVVGRGGTGGRATHELASVS